MISDRVGQLVIACVWAACLGSLSTPARAQSASFQVPISVRVQNGCWIATITAVNFGNIATVPLPAPDDASGQIRVVCRADNTRVDLALSPGQNHNGATRRMARTVGASTYFLEYELFEDAARTRRFVSDRKMVPRNPGRTWMVWGRIPAGAGALAGAGMHTDTIVVTATF